MIRPHPSIPSAWILSPDGELRRPLVGVFGALHGDETGGLVAIRRAMDEAESFDARLREGSVVFVHGNPRATSEGRRFSVGGADINRLFKYDYVDDLAKEAWTYEHHRALELRPLLADIDALLDLHSASQPTPAFAVCDGRPESIELAHQTGCRVTWGWDGPGMLMDHVSIGMVVARGKPALSIECGQHRDDETPKRAFQALTRFLGAIGVTDHPTAEAGGEGFEVFARVVKPTHEFALSRAFSSFDLLEAGAVLGSGEGVTIRVDRDAHLLLPTPTAQRGEDVVYLARRIAR